MVVFSVFSGILVLTCFAIIGAAAASLEEKTKLFYQSVAQIAASGECKGEKMDWMGTLKWMNKQKDECRQKYKNPISSQNCLNAACGLLLKDFKPFGKEKELAASIEKVGKFTKSFSKDCAREVFANKCHKLISEKRNKEKQVDGVICYLEAIVHACGGKM